MIDFLVFDALDRGRATSAMLRAQCLLLPLVLVIQETALLYDYLVKFLYRLHSECPPESLAEHRERFKQMFHKLKAFYTRSVNLQYFRNLVQIPTLPDEPPNFLDAAGLSRHHRLEVVVQQPEPEPEYDDDTDVNLSMIEPPPPPTPAPAPRPLPTASLVDTAEPPPRTSFDADDRDMIIKRLLAEIERLKAEMQRLIAQVLYSCLDDLLDVRESATVFMNVSTIHLLYWSLLLLYSIVDCTGNLLLLLFKLLTSTVCSVQYNTYSTITLFTVTLVNGLISCQWHR